MIGMGYAPLLAQTTSTTILGTITDSSGAVVPGAKVTALQVLTGLKREEATSNTGDYSFPLLNVGEYEVTVQLAGFKTEVRKNIVLQINQKARIDFTLQVGGQEERIDVSAEAALLRTDDATLGQVVDHRRVVELPLNGRNLGGLAVLQPGVQFGARMGFDGLTGDGGGVPVPGHVIAISANGQRDTNQHATLDGVVATEARVNTLPYTPSIEAVEEFKVQAGTYSAEYGTNSGAQLTIVLKSGTNDYHGTAFEFLRNDVLDAEDYFVNYFTAPGEPRNPKNQLRQNQYGGVISGPFTIPKLYNGKDRTFFMVDYEGRKRREPGGIGTSNVPPAAFRSGDLSALLNRHDDSGNPLSPVQIVDPLTGLPFPNNLIPDSRISAGAKNLMQFWPAPQRINPDPLSGINYVGPSNIKTDDHQVYVRIDHQISAKDKVFGHYAFDDITYANLPGDNPNFSYYVAGRNQNVAGQWVHIFSPQRINEFRYGFDRSVDNTGNPRTNTDFDLDELGLTGFRVVSDNNRKFTPREAGVPDITFVNFSNSAGAAALGDRDGGNGYDYNNQHQISDNLTFSRGAHSFKTGIDFRRVALHRAAANVPRGGISFDGDIAGNDFAAYLLGYPSFTQTPEGFPRTVPRQNRYGAYFLDDWKANRKLTLNLGLRYEYNSVATDIEGLWRSLSFRDKENGLPVLLPEIYTPYHFYSPEKKLFMPRVGLAYRLTDNWVVRSGYGIYHNVHQLNNYTILNLNPPLSGSSEFSQTTTDGRLDPTLPPLTFEAPFGAVDETRATNANALNPDNFEPRVHQWSLDVQRQLPFQTVLTVGYVGSRGTHIDNTVELNNPDPGLSSLPTTAQQRRPYQLIVDGPGGPQRTITRIRFLDAGANSWYHGLQVNAEKRFSHGLMLNVAYTFSKAMGEGYGRNEGAGALANRYQDPRNRQADRARYGFDVKHNAVISWLYEVPTPSAFRTGPGKWVLGGWQVNGIWTLRTGFPFVVDQNNTLNTFNSPTRPDRVRSGKVDNPTITQWFDTEAFRVVTCRVDYLADRCHYGSSGNAILDGPAFKGLDFSLFKNFTIREGMRLQFRAELFNVFNSPNFGTPNATLDAGSAFLPSIDPNTGQIGPDPVQGGFVGGPGAITTLVSPMRIIQFGLKFIF
jgi:Carboxypeptidase regulatory-like domain/TonB dependent receptor